MAEAPARTALAGNPSDGYGGAVLAVTVEAFKAQAVVLPAVADWHTAGAETQLVDATIERFHREIAPAAPRRQVECTTTIPRCVGLGGSSAIVIATLRALCEHHDIEIAADDLARLALSIEVDDIGIAAGLQDRIAQAYGGVTFMDFAGTGRYERLDPELLPPLVIAWREHAAEPSGPLHGDLKRRYEAGDPEVRAAMDELAELARAARRALSAGDGAALASAADATFDARARILPLDPRHVEMVSLARAQGAGANYTGSGGAIVCVCKDPRHRSAVARALQEERCGTVEI